MSDLIVINELSGNYPKCRAIYEETKSKFKDPTLCELTDDSFTEKGRRKFADMLARFDRIMILAGDGTTHFILNCGEDGQTNILFAGGTGNNVSLYNRSPANANQLVDLLEEGVVETWFAGDFEYKTTRRSFLFASGGLSGDILKARNEIGLKGKRGYVLAAFTRVLPRLKEYDISLEINMMDGDKVSIDRPLYGFVVSRISRYAGFVPLLPGVEPAKSTDEYGLDVLVIPKLGRAKVLLAFVSAIAGLHTRLFKGMNVYSSVNSIKAKGNFPAEYGGEFVNIQDYAMFRRSTKPFRVLTKK